MNRYQESNPYQSEDKKIYGSFEELWAHNKVTPSQIDLLVHIADQVLDFLVTYEQPPTAGEIEEIAEHDLARWSHVREKTLMAESMRALLLMALRPFVQKNQE